MTLKKKTFIVVTHIITKEEGGYVAECPEFDIASQGITIEEAEKNIKEATLLYLDTIEDLGTREFIFKEKKIKTYPYIPKTNKENIFVSRDPDKAPFITKQPIAIAG